VSPIDPFVVLLLATIGLAALLPARGAAAGVVSVATRIAIALLFLLYGARLSPAQAWHGLRHWRLHLMVLFGSANVGLIMLPLMLFHMIQVLVCAVIAGRLSRVPASDEDARPP
jgi:predicted Na+-dependent transporter